MGLTLTAPKDGSCLRERQRKELAYDVALFLLTEEISVVEFGATGHMELTKREVARLRAQYMRGNNHASK